MMILPILIKHALNVAVQRSHNADPRKHRRAARRRDQDQSLHSSLPLRGLVFGLSEASGAESAVKRRRRSTKKRPDRA
jgi:hypothetical protein